MLEVEISTIITFSPMFPVKHFYFVISIDFYIKDDTILLESEMTYIANTKRQGSDDPWRFAMR